MVRLTSTVKTSGCAAKLPPAQLEKILSSLPLMEDERLIVGIETGDDALAWDLGDGRVMIESVDFFPPVADDPYDYGQIAAANALSDIYAMGGEPAVAMNVMCFPSCMDLQIMRSILLGAQNKVREAGAVIAGGHTIADSTIKYGLSVTGFTTKDRLWTNKGARPGDVLVITKRLGVGIINTATKAGMASVEATAKALGSMKTLNRMACQAASGLAVSAATDITGFSLLGHLNEMCQGAGLSFSLDSASIPIFDEALEYARYGLIPEGAYSNREHLEGKVHLSSTLPRELEDVLYDPQTSGPLALAMTEGEAERFIEVFGDDARIIGHFQERGEWVIEVR